MRYRRALGLTLMEVLVAVTIFAVTASLLYLITKKVKWMSYEGECLSRMSVLAQAIMVYRSEWGNVEAEIGDASYLGFPSVDAFFRYRAVRVPGVLQAMEYLCLCPLAVDAVGERWCWYYAPSSKRANELTRITFQEATEVMRSATPIVVDAWHNAPDDWLTDPARPHRFIWMSLDGAVQARTLVGMLCQPYVPDPPARECLIEAWVRWYDEEAWRRLVMRPRGGGQ